MSLAILARLISEGDIMKDKLFFKTKENEYYYNDADGNIYKVNEKFNELKLENQEQSDLTDVLCKSGYNQLTLVVTQECNLRCTYCIYSGNYSNFRVHKNCFMKKDVALNAVDYYMTMVQKICETRPLFSPTISFYGGEPLLNYKLIKEVVEYVKRTYKINVIFNMTTNLLLLTDEILDFIIKYNIDVSVSLNGDRDNNDRMRVTKNGTGTFDAVYKNLRKIMLWNEEFYRNNVKIIVTYDKKTNMLKLNDFVENDPLIKGKVAIALPVKETFWDNNQIEENLAYTESIEFLEKDFLQKVYKKQYNKISSLQQLLFVDPLLALLDRTRNSNFKKIIPYTSMCVPGTKIAVDTDGTFHCCEKVNTKKSFGSEKIGINYKQVAAYINEVREFGEMHCKACRISRMCNLCFADMIGDDGKLVLPEDAYCDKLEHAVVKQLILYCSLIENGVDIRKLTLGEKK